MKDVEKDEVPSVFFALVFTGKTGVQQFQVPETRRKSLEKGRITLKEEGPDKGTFKHVGQDRTYRSMSASLKGFTH